MKHLSILRVPFDNNPNPHQFTLTVVQCNDEKWQFSANTTEEDNQTPRELSQLSMLMPNGFAWTGNIQNLAAIQAIAQNALNLIKKQASDLSDLYCQPDNPEIAELESLLSHFSKITSNAG